VNDVVCGTNRRIVVIGLSITSSWGNGHATNYRALVKELARRGHDVTFFERDVPWYAMERDLPHLPWGKTVLYGSLDELRHRATDDVRDADLVIVGSYVPEGADVGEWIVSTATGVTAFFDIDTPVTLARLERGDCEYLSLGLVPQYDIYLSCAGGPTLRFIEEDLGSPLALPFYCLVDPAAYYPEPVERRWDLGYLGTYSQDRQPSLDALLTSPARAESDRRFVVAGARYPDDLQWPSNVDRVDHIPPGEHRSFYNAQRFTLNVTRADMIRAGYSPSVRLFEAAACGTAIVSDAWPGIDEFFVPNEEILLADGPEDVLRYLREVSDEERKAIGARARERVLKQHTAARRVDELEEYVDRARRAYAGDAEAIN
jgi:spore maturation protein CgeB